MSLKEIREDIKTFLYSLDTANDSSKTKLISEIFALKKEERVQPNDATKDLRK